MQPRQSVKTTKDGQLIFKVLILGDSGVGKTSLLVRFCDDDFVSAHVATVGIDYKSKSIDIENERIKIEVWDTAGQERYGGIALSYYKSAMGIILGYSVDSRESFKNVNKWIKQISDNTDTNLPRILIGTKVDLSNRRVTYEEGRKLAESYGLRFFETSSKENYNVAEAFETIARDIKRKYIDKRQTGLETSGKESQGDMTQSILSPGRLRLGTEDRKKSCCS